MGFNEVFRVLKVCSLITRTKRALGRCHKNVLCWTIVIVIVLIILSYHLFGALVIEKVYERITRPVDSMELPYEKWADRTAKQTKTSRESKKELSNWLHEMFEKNPQVDENCVIRHWIKDINEGIEKLRENSNEAEEMFERARKRMPDFPTAHLGIGYSYYRTAMGENKNDPVRIEYLQYAKEHYEACYDKLDDYAEIYGTDYLYICGYLDEKKTDNSEDSGYNYKLVTLENFKWLLDMYIAECVSELETRVIHKVDD
ncbi:MAG: hypothetical protein K8R90_02725 [Candidatus Cloacimonetes bacterium]|nr:hypothetical protein [Candidatus Cloacimonadota bacterium]